MGTYTARAGTWNIRPLRGQRGPGGRSAYEAAVAAGFSGTEAQWLADLKGETGDEGPIGPPGPGTGAGAWQPDTAYTAGQVVQAPDGSIISRNATGSSRPSFDATEEAAWTAVEAKTGTIAQRALSAAMALLSGRLISVDSHGAVGDGVADDTAAINAAIAALGGAAGVIVFGAGRSYRTQGGHAFPAGTLVNFQAATVTHVGNNTCFSWAAGGGFNLNRPSGGYRIRLVGNSGADAVGVRNGNNWGWHLDGEIRGYMGTGGIGGVGLHFANLTNWTEGYDINGLKVDDCMIGWLLENAGGVPVGSFGYGRVRGLAMNVPANGVGVEIRGAAGKPVYLYNSVWDVTIWPNGNNATALKLNANVNTDNFLLTMLGEVHSGASFTGLAAIRNTGGSLKAIGRVNIKDAPNVTTGGVTRVLTAANVNDDFTGTGTSGKLHTWLASNEDVNHGAQLGYILGTNKATPYSSGFDQANIFEWYATAFGGKPSDVGARRAYLDREGGFHPGSVTTSLRGSTATGSPEGAVYGVPGDILQTPNHPFTRLWLKVGAAGNDGWQPLVATRIVTRAQRLALDTTSVPWGFTVYDSDAKGPWVWYDGRWYDADGYGDDRIYTHSGTATHNMVAWQQVVICTEPTGGATVNLPSAASARRGHAYTIRHAGASGSVTVTGGSAAATLAAGDTVRYTTNGTTWWRV